MALQFSGHNPQFQQFLSDKGYEKVSKLPVDLLRKQYCVYTTESGNYVSVSNGTGETGEKAGFIFGMEFYEWLIKTKRV